MADDTRIPFHLRHHHSVRIIIDDGQDRKRLLFDVVSSWEVMEHIADGDFHSRGHVKKHLAE